MTFSAVPPTAAIHLSLPATEPGGNPQLPVGSSVCLSYGIFSLPNKLILDPETDYDDAMELMGDLDFGRPRMVRMAVGSPAIALSIFLSLRLLRATLPSGVSSFTFLSLLTGPLEYLVDW